MLGSMAFWAARGHWGAQVGFQPFWNRYLFHFVRSDKGSGGEVKFSSITHIYYYFNPSRWALSVVRMLDALHGESEGSRRPITAASADRRYGIFITTRVLVGQYFFRA